METTILTPRQNVAGIEEMIGLLAAQFSPLHIYQFGQWERREQCHSIFIAPYDEAEIVFYLLLITEGTASRENEIQDFADRQDTPHKFIIHAHGEDILRRNLQQCNAYFTSVLNEGTLLYSANGLMGREKVQGPNHQRQLIRERAHWVHRHGMARAFMEAAAKTIDLGQDKAGVYLLHHACEQLCVGLILAFMGYRSDIRNLRRLLYVCGCFSPDPVAYFLGSPCTEELFSILMKSHYQARYNDDFSLEGHSPHSFLDLARGFEALALGLCEMKFGDWKL